MTDTVITDFCAAKRALKAAGVHDFRKVLDALGYQTPERARVDGRLVKVYVTEAVYLGHEQTAEYRGTRSVYEPSVPGVVVASSKKDAALRAGAPEHHLSGIVRVTGEIDPSDVRYEIAVSNPDKIVVTMGGSEFGEPLLLDLPDKD